MLDLKSKKNFCVMPWINLTTETDGACKLCSAVMTRKFIAKKDGSPFHLQNDDIEDIWNSDYLKDIRKKMLADEVVPDCQYCTFTEGKGAHSHRDSYNNSFLTEDVKRDVLKSQENEYNVSSLPISLEPRLGNICNLKCHSCCSTSSSGVYGDRKRILNEESIEKPKFLKEMFENDIKHADDSDLTWFNNERYLDNLRKCARTLKRVYFTGGEPTLIKSNISLLKELVDQKNTDVLILLTTNLTHINDELVELLQRFSSVVLAGSIDGYGHANDYIRYPSQWDHVSKNLLRLNTLSPKISVCVSSVVQAMNVFSMVDLIRWLEEFEGKKPMAMYITTLQMPEYLRLDILDDSLKKEAVNYIDDYLSTTKTNQPNSRHLHDIKRNLDITHPRAEQLRQQFKEYVQVIDKWRGLDFTKIFPHHKSFYSRIHSQTEA